MEVILCGICGYVNKENITKDNIIFNMTSTLKTDINKFVKTHINGNIALGCVSSNEVITITRVINDKSYTIVFNGELYNLDEIKEDLLSKGYDILIGCDAELTLLCYIEYGKDSLNKLNGVYSFAILNNNNSLFLARDRLGIKPLFYFNTDEFIFSSNIQAILNHPAVEPKIGKDEICEIFGLGPAHTPGKTFFKDIFELLPGHYAIYDKNGFNSYKYWDLETFEITDTIDESIAKVKTLVEDSLKKQMVTKRPICSMLSGGLDSSVLAYLASKEKEDLATFSIDFENNDKNFNGSDYQPTRDSDFVVIMKDYIKSNHTNLYFSTQDIFNNLKDAMIARNMPGMADVDSSMLVFLRKIKECGYDIAISGECSDEIFGGYPWYYKEHLINSKNFPWSRSTETRTNIINEKFVSKEYLENYIQNAFNKTSSNVVYNSEDINENTFRKTCYNTVKWFMNTLIERTERLANMAGVNVRTPFADYKIFEYVYNLSYKYKLGLVDGNDTPIEKYLLRKAFDKDLPENVVYRKKSPFPKTYDPNYTLALENEIKNIINKSTSPVLEIINVKYLYEILKTKGENLKENWFGQLMTYPQTLAYIIQVNMWLEEYNIKIDI